MDREPPVTVAAPQPGGHPPDVLEGASASTRYRWPRALAVLVAAAAVGVAAVRGGAGASAPQTAAPDPPTPTAPAAAATAGPAAATTGITAAASLAGAPTDQPYVQRLVLTVDLPASVVVGGTDPRPVPPDVLLLGVRVRGFTVEPDDPRSPLPLGRFGRSTSGRTTTVPLAATVVVDDCSVEPQARRDIVLEVRAGQDELVPAVADAEVVRALDRLVSRTCRRPRR